MNLSEARRISRCAGGDSLAHYTDDTAVTVEHCNDGTFIGLLREADAEFGRPDVQAFIWWGPPRRPRLTHQHLAPAGPGSAMRRRRWNAELRNRTSSAPAR